MEESNIPNDITPNVLDKIAEINDKLPGMYKAFETSYITWKSNPDNQEFYNTFNNIKLNLKKEQQVLSELFEKVNNAAENIQQKTGHLQKWLNVEKDKAAKVSGLNSAAENVYNASAKRISDFSSIYKSEYFYNLVLFIGAILVIFYIFFGKLFAGMMEQGQGQAGNESTQKKIKYLVGAAYFIIVCVYGYKYGIANYTFIFLMAMMALFLPFNAVVYLYLFITLMYVYADGFNNFVYVLYNIIVMFGIGNKYVGFIINLVVTGLYIRGYGIKNYYSAMSTLLLVLYWIPTLYFMRGGGGVTGMSAHH